MERRDIFVSYAHRDFKHLEALTEFLSPFLRNVPLRTWDDRKIGVGEQWQKEIDAALESAQVAVLLVTKSFLASNFIAQKEFPEILKAQEQRNLRIFWILISDCAWRQTELRRFQAANDLERPLAAISPVAIRDKAWVAVVDKLMEAAGLEDDSPAEKRRVVLLHKDDCQPDKEVLEVLQSGFTNHGFEVFTITSLSVPILNQLDIHLNKADAVIPLISQNSHSSEILELQVETARKKAEKQNGHPKLIPVLLQFNGDSRVLGVCPATKRFSWLGPQDNETLVTSIVDMLNGKEVEAQPPAVDISSKQTASIPSRRLTGAMAPQNPYYIERQTDIELGNAIADTEAVILINGSRQMGKTSLIARGLERARKQGSKAVFTDFQQLNVNELQSVDEMYMHLAQSIVDGLDLEDVQVDKLWRPTIAASWNLERILKREVLPRVETRLVWAMDEVERLFSFGYAADFFGLLRSWYNKRQLALGDQWERLTLMISYATEAHLLIDDMNQSPFNVGRKILLSDFSLQQVRELNDRHGSRLNGEQLAQVCRLLNGQPYLSQQMFGLVEAGADLSHLLEVADEESGPFGDHLRYIFAVLNRQPALVEAVRAFLAENREMSDDEFFRLRAAGICGGQYPNNVKLRCQLYERYLKKRLLSHDLRKGA